MLTLLPLLAGCATKGGPVQTDPCAAWRPIYVSPDDVLTDATARAILKHDRTGAKLCGWKPKAPTH